MVPTRAIASVWLEGVASYSGPIRGVPPLRSGHHIKSIRQGSGSLSHLLSGANLRAKGWGLKWLTDSGKAMRLPCVKLYAAQSSR